MSLRDHCLISARFLIICTVLATNTKTSADPILRSHEIAHCSEHELATWGDGNDRRISVARLTFFYRHDGAPAWLRQHTVLELLQKSVNAWSLCGVPSKLDLASESFHSSPENILIGWNASSSFGYFGLANLATHQLTLGVQAFHLLNGRNPWNNHAETLQMVISHEMGHFYGLMAHSRRCIDVLSYYHDGKGGECYTKYPHLLNKFPEYRSALPTACDIQRCKKLNGKS